MSHVHKIVDTDLHFIIDPITRTIENQGEKRYLTQFDHESERLTFGIQRFVEGHDMTLCDRIEIHYTNITKKKDAQNDGMYVIDRDDREFTDDLFKFSWNVRRESTQLAGILKFSITFLCGNEFSEIIYEWSTTEYKSIQILPKLDHSEEIVAKYPDLFVMLKREIYDEGMVIEDIQQTTISEESGGVNSFTVTLLDGSTRIFNVMNGVDGRPGVYIGSGDAPEDYDIQIDPDAVEPVAYVTREEFELSKTDWNQNDPEASDYVKNKPFGEETFENVVVDYTVSVTDGFGYKDDISPIDLIGGMEYKLYIDDELFGEYVYIEGTPPQLDFFDSKQAHVMVVGAGVIVLEYFADGEYQVKVVYESSIIKSINEKYIPDTISREGHVHSYNDLTDRTHYEEEKMGYLFEFDSNEGNPPPGNHDGTCIMVEDSGYRFVNGKTYTITTVDIYGVEISVDVVCNNFELVTFPVNSQGETMHQYKLYQREDESNTTIYGELDNWINYGGRSVLKLYGFLKHEVKQLDEKYIPDNIARKSDMLCYTETNIIQETRTVPKTLLDADFVQLLLKNRQSAEYLYNDKSFVYLTDLPTDVITWFIGSEDGARIRIVAVKNSADSVVEDKIDVQVPALQITVNVAEEIVHQLDEKYIPDNIARKTDIQGDNTFMITLIDNGDGTYSVDKTYEEIIQAHFLEKRNLVLDNSCLSASIPIPNSLPSIGYLGGGFQFGIFGDDNATNSDANPIPVFSGLVITPGGFVSVYAKSLFDCDIDILKTTNKSLIGAINELKAEIDALKSSQ